MDYEWHTLSIADQVTLATRFSSVRRIGTGLRPPKKPPARNSYPPPPATNQFRRSGITSSTVRSGSGSKFRPAANPANAANMSCRSTAHFLRQHPPRNPALEDEHDAHEARTFDI